MAKSSLLICFLKLAGESGSWPLSSDWRHCSTDIVTVGLWTLRRTAAQELRLGLGLRLEHLLEVVADGDMHIVCHGGVDVSDDAGGDKFLDCWSWWGFQCRRRCLRLFQDWIIEIVWDFRNSESLRDLKLLESFVGCLIDTVELFKLEKYFQD